MRLALFEDFGDVVGILEVVLGGARDGAAGVVGLATADGGRGIAGAVQKVALRAPEDVGGLEDVDRLGLERGGQSITGLDQPQHVLQVVVADDALAQHLLALRVGVGKDHATDVAMRVDADRQVEPIVQGFRTGIVAGARIVRICQRRVQQMRS